VSDRTQNINVNYNFKTVGVDQARAAVASVDTATKNLQQSAQTSGQKISSAFQQSTQSVLAMQTQLARLKSQIEVTSNPQRIAQLTTQYKTLKTQLDATTKAYFDQGKAIKEVSDNTKTLTSGLGNLYTALKTVIAGAVIKEVAGLTLEMAKLAGNSEGVERAFKRAFPGSIALLNDLKTATHGTVTEFELMQRTLQATNLGVAVEQLPVLFEFAAARAQQTGESVDYLVDSIVRGIGRKSILVLDNLGLSATRLREQFHGASLASQSVADVTKGVAAIAKVELDKMGGYAETSATKVDQITVSWQKLRLELSKRVTENSGGLMQFFQDAIDGTAKALTSTKEIRQAIAENAALVEFNSLKEGKINDKKINDEQKLIDSIQEEIRIRLQSLKENNVELLILKQRYDEAAKSRKGSLDERFNRKKQIVDEGTAILQNNLFLNETIKLLKFYFDGIMNANNADKEQLGIIERKKQEIEKLQEAIEKTNRSSDLSSQKGVGKLVNALAVAQSELKELLEGPANIEFNVKFKIDKDKVLKDFENLTEIAKSVPAIPVPVKPVIITPKTFGDQLAEEVKKNQNQIFDESISIFADQLISFETAEVDSLQNRLNNLRNFYDEQQILAGDNDRAKAQLRLKEEKETADLQKRIAAKQKEARRFSVVIDTAAGIMKAFATAATIPQAIIQAALVALKGASELAIINRTPAKFAKGVLNLKGPGTDTSDNIPAMLSPGESVMTAKQTRKSLGLLEAIRDNKIDDRVLRNLQLSPHGVRIVPWDNKPVVEAINRNKAPDLVKQGRQIYEVHEDIKKNKRYIRSKSMG
jgi:hypothetical protein